MGVGLAPGDISLRGIEICKRSKLFAEKYTSFISDSYLKEIERLSGKEAALLERSDLEEGARHIAEQASKEDIAILAGGDPLIATTHKILSIEAKRAGAKLEIVHSSSIFSVAIGESGLDFYKFGQICTIPAWSEHYKPVSFYETIYKNMERGLHSLVLLDYSPQYGGSLSIAEAASELEAAERHYIKGLITDSTMIIVLHNIAQAGESRILCTFKELKSLPIGDGRSVILIPAKLSDIESEIIKSIY
ncbi:MAG: diphthine synthase [Candidatus Micrarchaeaceae archaeon]